MTSLRGHVSCDVRGMKTTKATPNTHERSDAGHAFLPDPFARREESHTRAEREELVEELGEGFVAAATAGQPVYQDRRQAVDVGEVGGPFVTTTEGEELARDVDESNPEDATKEPFPSALRAPSEPARS